MSGQSHAATVAQSAPCSDGRCCDSQTMPDHNPQSRRKVADASDAGRLWRALGYSWAGVRAAWATESAFRQEVVAAALLLPLALWLPVSRYEQLALVASLLLVLIVELLNSAVETAIDLVSPDPHPLAGRAKDFGSAAVLLALVVAVAVWSVVLFTLLRG